MRGEVWLLKTELDTPVISGCFEGNSSVFHISSNAHLSQDLVMACYSANALASIGPVSSHNLFWKAAYVLIP